jgi:NAD(P)-dependent dehydrogenase (short-subunit alcohol dehydrogenase family)
LKTAVITGASAGIGLATADRFAREGWQVAILARDPERLEAARSQIARHGGEVLAVPTDVSDAEAVDDAADKIFAQFGAIDVWVNNAMSTVVGDALQITPQEYERVTASTYLSTVYGTRAALRHMRGQGRGAVVQISSMLAIQPAPLQAAYCGAKSAVGGFTRSVRGELTAEKSPITLSLVYLPGVDTPQSGWSRNHTGRAQIIPDPLFHPDLCAKAVFSAVANRHPEVWVGRSTILMALVHAIAPWLTARLSADPEQQLGGPEPRRLGNLEQPAPGPARVQGDGADRVVKTGREFMSTRQRRLIETASVVGLTGLSAFLGYALARRRN